jgi:hypothetical protein
VSGQLCLDLDPLLSPAQLAFFGPIRARFARDRRRDPSCLGCEAFGLCVLHGVGLERVRRHGQRGRS